MINGGPARLSGSTSRQAMYRNESARRQPESSQPIEPGGEVPRARQYQGEESVERAPRKARNLGWVKWVVSILIVVLLAVAGWLFWQNQQGVAAAIDSEKYQAVFLSNGQVYFGKLAIVNGEYMELTNVYYLERQITTNATTGAETESSAEQSVTDNNFQLLKYSDVLYGSEDAMIISKDDIIRFENLRTDGVVAKAIANRR